MQSADVWSDYAARLRRRGLSTRDAAALVRIAKVGPAPHGASGSLFRFIATRLPLRTWQQLLDVVVEAQTRGPQQPAWSEAWRALYVAGCPLAHISCVLFHSFADPDRNPQDRVWLRRSRALKNVRRYIDLGFPRAAAWQTYGPGLGCETLVQNARSGVRVLHDLGAPRTLLLQSVNRCRCALSPNLRAAVDDAADVHAPTFRRPPKAETDALFKKLATAGYERLTADERLRISLVLQLGADLDEVLVVDGDSEMESLAVRWFAALDALFADRRVAVDLGRDRYRLTNERARPIVYRRRSTPKPPRAAPIELQPLLARWRRRNPLGNNTNVAELDHEDPLHWLGTVAEMIAAPGQHAD
ncbi:MAG: hypothetical protein ACHREM_11405 [Polyangiales bacterium]